MYVPFLRLMGVTIGSFEIFEAWLGVKYGAFLLLDVNKRSNGWLKMLLVNAVVLIYFLLWIFQLTLATSLIYGIMKDYRIPIKMWMIVKKIVVLAVVVLILVGSLFGSETVKKHMSYLLISVGRNIFFLIVMTFLLKH